MYMDQNLSEKKARFFKNGLFRINLSRFEIDNRILIPGHRFIPYANPGLYPWNFRCLDGNGNLLLKKQITVYSDDIKKYYKLFGEENFLFLLINDVEKNREIILKESREYKKFFITVFDLNPLFSDSSLQSETEMSAVELRITDWENGEFNIRLTESRKNDADVSIWIRTLEKGLVMADSGRIKSPTVQEFLSTAFYFGGDYLIKNPVISLDEFTEISDESFIHSFNTNKITSIILKKKKAAIRIKISELIKELTDIEKTCHVFSQNCPGGISADKFENARQSLKVLSSELDNPDLNEEKLNIIINVISDSEKLIASVTG